MKLDVKLLPKESATGDLSDTVCIVLDIFRATTCIVTSMANGCKTMIPVLSIEDAKNLAAHIGPALMAGERQSIKIEGCHIGNSPYEFCEDIVNQATIVMTTTNGTVAIKATDGAYRTLIGSFLNAGALCRKAKQYDKDILIVCAGTDGLFSLEDALCAGFLIELLRSDGQVELTDSAQGAHLMYLAAKNDLLAAAINSRNGQRLVHLNKMDDIRYCFQIDLLDIVPEYEDGRIKMSGCSTGL